MTTYHNDYLNNPLVKALMSGTLDDLKEVLKDKYKEYKNKEELKPPETSEGNEESETDKTKNVPESTLDELIDKNTKITPLCQLSHKTNEESLEITKLLVEDYKLCSPNHVDLIGQTCMFYAARDGRAELCSNFCKYGCDPNHKDRLGQTSMFYAARDGHSEVIKVLVENGADVNITDTNSQTCLFYAARDGRVEAVKVLLEKKVNYAWKDLQRRTALSFAKSKGHNEIVNLLRKSSPEKHTTPPQPKRTLESELSVSFEGDPHSGVPLVSGDSLTSKPKRYRLQYRPFAEDEKLWLDAPLVKVQEFELRFPELAKWDKDSAFPPSNTLRNPLLKQWYSLAQNLLSTLLKQEGGYVFDKPVDPKKQNCPDYYDIIKKPMSFSCIRGKLRKNSYTDPQEFVDDVLLIFENCSKYNKPETWVASIGNNLRDFFKQQLTNLGFNEFVKKEQLVKQLLQQSQLYLNSKNPNLSNLDGNNLLNNNMDGNKLEQNNDLDSSKLNNNKGLDNNNNNVDVSNNGVDPNDLDTKYSTKDSDLKQDLSNNNTKSENTNDHLDSKHHLDVKVEHPQEIEI